MFASLRSRLWLTYALSILTALLVVAVIFLIYLLDNPLVYRQTKIRLSSAQGVLLAKQSTWANLPAAQLQSTLIAQAQEETAFRQRHEDSAWIDGVLTCPHEHPACGRPQGPR